MARAWRWAARKITKDYRLPFGDPETLRLFLKVIDEFTYDHSERLGDAFEYLLSVLGSQGDAGQFRTPRHIIDFIVAIVDHRMPRRTAVRTAQPPTSPARSRAPGTPPFRAPSR